MSSPERLDEHTIVIFPSQILSGLRTRSDLSLLETMPSEIQIAIFKKLHWVDRAYLALTCKTLAGIGSTHMLLDVSIHTVAGVRFVWHLPDAECYEETRMPSERLNECCAGPSMKHCPNCASWKAELDAKIAESESHRVVDDEDEAVVSAMAPLLGHGEENREYSVWQRVKMVLMDCSSCPQCWKVMPYSG